MGERSFKVTFKYDLVNNILASYGYEIKVFVRCTACELKNH